MGRDHADEINVAIVVPPPTKSTRTPTTGTATTPVKKPAAKPKPPAKVAFSPKKKLRIWVAGDSLVITPGYAVVRAAGGSPAIESVGGVDGHVATGLTRPDVFNWFQEIATKVKELKPNVVVLNFGGNDNHGYMTGLPQGVSIGEFARAVVEQGVPPPPPHRDGHDQPRRRDGGLDRASDREQPDGDGRASTRSTRSSSRRRSGAGRRRRSTSTRTRCSPATTAASPSTSRTRRATRSRCAPGDGVHFDTAGGDMIAREVLRQLNKVYDLTSWRHKSRRARDRLRRPPPGRQRRRPEQRLDAEAARGARRAWARGREHRAAERQRPLLLVEERGRRDEARAARRWPRASGSRAPSSSARRRSSKAVAAKNPFVRRGETRDPKTLHVAFLEKAPAKAAVAKLDPDRSPPDAFGVRGREVYLSYPNGSGRTKLSLSYLERVLGVEGTARNWRTVQRLAELLAARPLSRPAADVSAARLGLSLTALAARTSRAHPRIGATLRRRTRRPARAWHGSPPGS